MNMCIDIGNTRVKCALFNNSTLTSIKLFSLPLQKNPYLSYVKKHLLVPQNMVILSDVTSKGKSHLDIKTATHKQSLIISQLKLPIYNKYKEPDTLGTDRLSLTCGAVLLYPQKNILIISAGTCITYDMVTSKKEYIGGAISPGLLMRLKSMHDYTARLPLIKKIPENITLNGATTHEAMLSGAIKGSLAEIAYTIDLYSNIYSNLHVIITGGDAPYLQARLKCKIFAQPNLALIGLNTILKLNAKNLNST